jgi:hypothetical protein
MSSDVPGHGFIKPKKTARAVNNITKAPFSTSNRMAPLAHLPYTDSITQNTQKPPQIFLDKITSEANSCEIRH